MEAPNTTLLATQANDEYFTDLQNTHKDRNLRSCSLTLFFLFCLSFPMAPSTKKTLNTTQYLQERNSFPSLPFAHKKTQNLTQSLATISTRANPKPFQKKLRKTRTILKPHHTDEAFKSSPATRRRPSSAKKLREQSPINLYRASQKVK